MKKTIVLLISLVGIVGVLLLVILASGIKIIEDKQMTVNSYSKCMELGAKYVDTSDYSQAIAAFKAAIREDPTQEDSYYQLAIIFIKTEDMEEAYNILKQGLDNTRSNKLQVLYDRYFVNYKEPGSDDKEKTFEEERQINGALCNIISNYSYDDYRLRYPTLTNTTRGGVHTIKLKGFAGTIHFFDVEGVSISINKEYNEPYLEVRPNYVVLDNLSHIFVGIKENEKIDVSEISKMGGYEISRNHNYEFGKYVRFVYDHCVFEIALDENGCFSANSKHKLYSEFGIGSAFENITYTGTIRVLDAVSAQPLENAKLRVYDQDNDFIWEGNTNSNGYCNLEVPEGSHSALVVCDGYIEEEINFQVYSTGKYSITQIVLSPELQPDEMRIVLEWQDWPTDLDSYYGDMETGRLVSYRNKQLNIDGELVAELDVDDTDGYGPETITVYDLSRDFSYYIVDFTNSVNLYEMDDITIKIYMSGEAPIVFHTNVSSSLSDNAMHVFDYIDGEIQFVGQPIETTPVSGKN